MSLPDLTELGNFLSGFRASFWLLTLVALAMTIGPSKTRQGKIVAVLSVSGLLLILPMAGCDTRSQVEKAQAAQVRQERQERLATAEAMFQERCKQAGEFIHRTVEDVEGVYLLKLRPGPINYGAQYRMDDPYGYDLTGDGYIRTFLRARNEEGFLEAMQVGGYRYVDADDPNDGQRYRYTGRMKVVGKQDVNARGVQIELAKDPNYDLNIYAFGLDRVVAPDPAPRYGVTYDDISTKEDRDHWIAGSSLKVIDLKTGEVMAERIGYMIDPGQGNDSGGRAPWLLAKRTGCPYPPDFGQTRNFVEKTLKPRMEK